MGQRAWTTPCVFVEAGSPLSGEQSSTRGSLFPDPSNGVIAGTVQGGAGGGGLKELSVGFTSH